MNFERIDAEEQVLAERALCDHFLQIAVGRAHDAHIHVKRFVLADAADFARFQKPEQLDLHRLVEFAQFVEKQRPAVGDFDQPLARRVGSGECPFAMSEQFAFDQVFRQRAAIDGTNGLFARLLNS